MMCGHICYLLHCPPDVHSEYESLYRQSVWFTVCLVLFSSINLAYTFASSFLFYWHHQEFERRRCSAFITVYWAQTNLPLPRSIADHFICHSISNIHCWTLTFFIMLTIYFKFLALLYHSSFIGSTHLCVPRLWHLSGQSPAFRIFCLFWHQEVNSSIDNLESFISSLWSPRLLLILSLYFTALHITWKGLASLSGQQLSHLSLGAKYILQIDSIQAP